MKKRARPLMLVWTPCSRNRSRNSRRNICGRASQVFKINAACASMRRGAIAFHPLGRDIAFTPELGLPTARRGDTDPKACSRLPTRGPRFYGADDAATKIEGKGGTHDGARAATLAALAGQGGLATSPTAASGSSGWSMAPPPSWRRRLRRHRSASTCPPRLRSRSLGGNVSAIGSGADLCRELLQTLSVGFQRVNSASYQ